MGFLILWLTVLWKIVSGIFSAFISSFQMVMKMNRQHLNGKCKNKLLLQLWEIKVQGCPDVALRWHREDKQPPKSTSPWTCKPVHHVHPRCCPLGFLAGLFKKMVLTPRESDLQTFDQDVKITLSNSLEFSSEKISNTEQLKSSSKSPHLLHKLGQVEISSFICKTKTCTHTSSSDKEIKLTSTTKEIWIPLLEKLHWYYALS